MNKMKLSEVIKLHQSYQMNEMTHDAFVEALNNVYVKSYITIREKIAGVINVLFGCEYDEESIVERYAQLEMNKFWYIMMLYTDIEMEEEYINEDNYELLYPTLSTAIYTYAMNDFSVTLRIMEQIINDNRYGEMIEIFESISGTNFDELIQKDNEVMNALKGDKEFINNLVQLFNHTDPAIGKINKEIEKSVAKEIKKTKE